MKAKKILCVLLSALMLTSVFTISAFADEEETEQNGYEVYVNGQKFSETVTEIACGSGTATYDAENATLTLEDAEITTYYEYKPQYQALIYSAEKNLDIELVGENKLVGQDPYDDGIDAAGGCNITVFGDGTLDISEVYYGFYIGSWDVEGGDLVFSDTTVNVKAKKATGIWVNHDIDFIDSTVTASTESKFYSGIVSNTDGTITVTDGELNVNAPGVGILMGNRDETDHVFTLNSGAVNINAGTGIYCEPVNGDGDINGTIYINGGTLTVVSEDGGTNIEDVELDEGVNYLEGTSLLDSGRVVIGDGEAPTTEPATSEPVTTEPATTEPATTEPVTTEPVTTEPATTEPATTEPATTEPVTTEPVTTEPVTTEPETTQPATKAPSLTYTKKSIQTAGKFTLAVKNKGSNKVTFATGNKKVATVTSRGVVTGLQRGSAIIKVTVGGELLKCKVTVTNNAILKYKKKALSTKSYKVKKGKSLTFKVYRRVSSIKIVYSVSNKKIAKVTSKAKSNTVVIKGLKVGTATISVKLNGVKTYKIKVKVVK